MTEADAAYAAWAQSHARDLMEAYWVYRFRGQFELAMRYHTRAGEFYAKARKVMGMTS